MTLDNFDRIIDDVAKEMTSAAVDASLARRAAARIAAVDGARRAIWRRQAVVAPLAAACVILGAVFALRDKERVAPPQALTSARHPAARLGSSPADGVHDAQSAGTLVRRPRTQPLALVQDIKLAPIVVDTVDVAPIVRAEQIEIDPIPIARIEIKPLR